MQGKKYALSKFLQVTGLYRVLLRGGSPSLMVFNFHRIRDDEAPWHTEFDEEVFGPTASEFRTHLKWLKKNSDIISQSDLLSTFRNQKKLPQHSTMVTFDDGYVDNFTLAWPILRELRIPAIFFIPPNQIEQRSLGWWDQIAYMIKKSRKPEIQDDPPGLRRQLFEKAKLRTPSEIGQLLSDTSSLCEAPLPTREICSRELMTWDQIRQVAAGGITIGSHAYSDCVLSALSLDAQREELQRSKAELELNIRQPIRTLAYPVGGYEHFNIETREIARECGYEAAFSFTHEVNSPNILDRYAIRRLVPPEKLSVYAGILSCPSIFARRRSAAEASISGFRSSTGTAGP